MEERLEDRPRLVEPVTVHFRAEGLPGSCRDDLQEPVVEASALVVLAERFDNSQGQVLQAQDFPTLVVEAVKGVFKAPVGIRLVQQCFQRGQIGLERPQKRFVVVIDVVGFDGITSRGSILKRQSG